MDIPYISVTPQTDITALALPTTPFAVLIIDPDLQPPVTQSALAHALLDAGCVSLGAWGTDSIQWDDAGDYACLLHPNGTVKEPPDWMDTWWFDDAPLTDALHLLALQAEMLPANPLILEFGTALGPAQIKSLTSDL